MDKARYEWKKEAKKAKEKGEHDAKYGPAGHLARKITARRKHFDLKRKAKDLRIIDLREEKKEGKIGTDHRRWNAKSEKWAAKEAVWDKKWDHRTAKFNARMRKKFSNSVIVIDYTGG